MKRGLFLLLVLGNVSCVGTKQVVDAEPSYYDFDPSTKYFRYHVFKTMVVTFDNDTFYMSDRETSLHNENELDGFYTCFYHDTVIVRTYTRVNHQKFGVDCFYDDNGNRTQDCSYSKGELMNCSNYTLTSSIDSTWYK